MPSLASVLQQQNIQAREIKPVFLSFGYFFCILCSYYLLRPLRDEMGIIGGIENLPWVFSATFIAILILTPVYGFLCSRYPRRVFLPLVYGFFILNLIIFFALFRFEISYQHTAQAFFIWASVFNLFVVSVFWSFMDDLYSLEQGKRLFALIASGGTLGAIVGPLLTAIIVPLVGMANLLLISIGFLSLAVLCIFQLSQWSIHQSRPASRHSPSMQSQVIEQPNRSMGGHWLAGFRLIAQSPYLQGIALLMLLFTGLSTFLYFQQAQIIRDTFTDSQTRTSVFATIDFAVNSLTLILQFFITSRVIHYLGLAWTLALIPALLCLGFIMLSLFPVFALLATVQILRRAGNYAIMRPAREMLYIVVGREEKYKAKSILDTMVYRGGDALSAWLYDGLRVAGLNLSQIALLAAPVAAIWSALAFTLGRKSTKLSLSQPTQAGENQHDQ